MSTRYTIFAAALVMSGLLPAQNLLSTGQVPPTLCAGSGPVIVPYDATGGFGADNVFTAELSDPNGDFNSPTIIGSVATTTSGIIPGMIPGATSYGTGYRIRVIASSPMIIGSDNGMDITVNEIPDAGISSVMNFCSDGPAVDLTSMLAGTPDVGGVWTGPDGEVIDGMFDPSMDTPGIHLYTVLGGACQSATSLLYITIVQAVFAGQDYTGPLCHTGAPFFLLPYLGEGAQPGGAWTGPAGPSNGIFIPGVHPPGCYTHTVQAALPCANDVAVICITGLVEGVDAGTDSSVVVCMNDGQYDLSMALGGTPGPGGIWTGPDGNVIPDGMVDLSGSGIGEFTFTHTIEVDPPCDGTASVNLNIVPCLGLHMIDAEEHVRLFSHGGGRFTLAAAEGMLRVRIMDTSGRILFIENDLDRAVMFDLPPLRATAVHLVEVTTASGRHLLRVIAQ